MITTEIIKQCQTILENTFEDYKVRYSEVVCDIHNCSNGNVLKCSDGTNRYFKRYIDTRRKNIYWCF